MAHSKEFSNSDKLESINSLLQEGYVLAHVDPSIQGTVIPENLKQAPSVSLKLDYSFRGHLELNDKAVLADLLFDGSYFSCVLPLESIWAVTDSSGANHTWPNTTAQQILALLLKGTSSKKAAAPKAVPEKELPSKPAAKKGSHLKRVK